MMQLARRALLVVVLLLASFGAIPAADLPKPVVVEEGVRQDGGVAVKFSVSLAEQVPPGSWIVYNFARYGDAPAVASAIEYYYAGISQGTIHLFRIVREVAPSRETERRPILLPLDANGTALLLIRPQEGRPFTVRLKRSADGSTLNASVVK